MIYCTIAIRNTAIEDFNHFFLSNELFNCLFHILIMDTFAFPSEYSDVGAVVIHSKHEFEVHLIYLQYFFLYIIEQTFVAIAIDCSKSKSL